MLSLKQLLCELNTKKAEIEVGGREGRRKIAGGRKREEKKRVKGPAARWVRGERRRKGPV